MAAGGSASQKQIAVAESWENWPDLEYPDIHNFLIEQTSEHTKGKIKSLYIKASMVTTSIPVNGLVK